MQDDVLHPHIMHAFHLKCHLWPLDSAVYPYSVGPQIPAVPCCVAVPRLTFPFPAAHSKLPWQEVLLSSTPSHPSLYH